MKTVKVTMVFEFEVEDSDDDTIKEGLRDAFDELEENDELLVGKTKIKITDLEEDDEDLEPEFEDDED